MSALPTEPAPRIRPTRAIIDLGALVANARALAARAPGAELIAVIKADAYGHGAVAAARALVSARAASGLAVSLVEEGLELRAAGVDAPVLVLAGPFTGAHDEILAHALTPVVSDVADLEAFAAAGARRGVAAQVHLKIDTGMARLGIPASAIPAALRVLAGGQVTLAGVATHLACADVPGPEGDQVSRAQLARFADARGRLRAAGISPALVHVANSAGLLRFPEAHLGAVRPGLALYGVTPPATQPPPLAPVLRWTSAIVVERDLAAGEPVGYGGLWRASRPSRVATVPVGYADGYPRRGTGAAQVLIAGQRCPVVGAISMDLIVIDVTDVPRATSRTPGSLVGSEVVLVGAAGTDRITAEEVAGWVGTIPYEILTGVGNRVPRVYVAAVTS